MKFGFRGCTYTLKIDLKVMKIIGQVLETTLLASSNSAGAFLTCAVVSGRARRTRLQT